jgi:hypothetical protein
MSESHRYYAAKTAQRGARSVSQTTVTVLAAMNHLRGGAQMRKRMLIVGFLCFLLPLSGCDSAGSGPEQSPGSGTATNSIVLHGPGDHDSEQITTDESDYLIQWQASNLESDPQMPTLPCMFEIVYYRQGGAGAENGGGGYGAVTLHTHYSSASSDSGQGTFKPHSGQGYLSVRACDQAQWVVTMKRLS